MPLALCYGCGAEYQAADCTGRCRTCQGRSVCTMCGCTFSGNSRVCRGCRPPVLCNMCSKPFVSVSGRSTACPQCRRQGPRGTQYVKRAPHPPVVQHLGPVKTAAPPPQLFDVPPPPRKAVPPTPSLGVPLGSPPHYSKTQNTRDGRRRENWERRGSEEGEGWRGSTVVGGRGSEEGEGWRRSDQRVGRREDGEDRGRREGEEGGRLRRSDQRVGREDRGQRE
eukprot:Sspe_Gene.101660::Locus_76275_Transcript_1_1_Confidence_1.000_Length_720::g.101660::m.101660